MVCGYRSVFETDSVIRRDGEQMVNGTDDYDYCEECRLYGDDYSYDRDGDLVSNCYDCPMNPKSDAWMRRTT